MNKALLNYECEGQLSIFDIPIKEPEPVQDLSERVGEWVEEHGDRVMFEDIKEGHYYIADYSTVSHEWYKIVFVKWVKDDSVGYVDAPKGVKGKWSWGNSYSALTRKQYINEPQTCGCKWYKLPSEEPKQQDTTDEYIKEHPTCFYVFGYYLDRADGWYKVPEELPAFATWQKVDVVVFGKKTGTPWMEHGKWEAKDWTFRSLDERRDTESTEILAWKVSD